MTKQIANDRAGEVRDTAVQQPNNARRDRPEDTAKAELCNWKTWLAERAEASD